MRRAVRVSRDRRGWWWIECPCCASSATWVKWSAAIAQAVEHARLFHR